MAHVTLGVLIRTRRREKGWTQERLGELIGKDQHYISQVENGKIKIPARAVLVDLARVLEIPEAEIAATVGWTFDGITYVLPAVEDMPEKIDLSDPLLNLWASHAGEFTPEERQLLEDLTRMILKNKRERQQQRE